MIGHNAQDRDSRCVRTTDVQVQKRTDTVRGIRMASLNIQTGRLGGLDTELLALQKGNVDVGFLQETKLM